MATSNSVQSHTNLGQSGTLLRGVAMSDMFGSLTVRTLDIRSSPIIALTPIQL